MDTIAWYYLDGRAARLFRPGEWIESGERLGAHGGRDVIHRESAGRVVSIQYDVWRDEVIIGVASTAAYSGALASPPSIGFAPSH